MRVLGVAFLFLSLISWPVGAQVSVSPVIVEADAVQKGDSFQINCSYQGEKTANLELSLALFDQDANGGVIFLEDEQALRKANSLLALDRAFLQLAPNQEEVIKVQVADEISTTVSVVLFVKSKPGGIPTRLAVLFLLSAPGMEEEVVVTSWSKKDESLAVTVENRGKRHGLWLGELALYDSYGNLAEKMELQSGLVLAGRSRNLEVTLPGWAAQFELQAHQVGLQLWD